LVDIEINVFEGTNFLTFELINAFDGTLWFFQIIGSGVLDYRLLV
jgi:hypothetical protein